jgi:hypothetical protein
MRVEGKPKLRQKQIPFGNDKRYDGHDKQMNKGLQGLWVECDLRVARG